MAVSYIGVSNLITTNGGVPSAITPAAGSLVGDFLLFYHYSRAVGGNETVTIPTGFTSVFNGLVANNGLLAVGYRFRLSGDTSFTATITNHTSSTTGETVLEFIETYRGVDPTTPIDKVTAALSTWATSLNLGSIVAPSTATVNNGDMVVVFGGRFENISAQTVLTGDSLTWANRTLIDTNLGTDAGAVTQNGLNSSGSDKTVTAKTITSTGTTGAGAGIMFIIEAKADITASVTETASATDTQDATVVLPPDAPSVLGSTTKGVTASGTNHVVTLPSGIQTGELLVIAVSSSDNSFGSGFTDSGGDYWRGLTTISNPVGCGSGFYWKYSNGSDPATVTLTTSVARIVAWIAYRVGDSVSGTRKVRIHSFMRAGDNNTTAINVGANYGVRNGTAIRDVLALFHHGLTNTNTITVGPSSGYSVVSSNMGSGDGVTVGGMYVQQKSIGSMAAYAEENPSDLTANAINTGYCHSLLVAFTGENGEDAETIKGGFSGTRDTIGCWFSQGVGVNQTNWGSGQTFRASGGKIKRAIFHLMRENVLHTTGTIVAKIYAHTGTFGSTGTPTGASLATSDSINIDGIAVAPSTYSNTCPLEFVFPTPYQTTNDTDYVLTLEVSGAGTTYALLPITTGATGYGGNRVVNTAGTWSANTADAQIQLFKTIDGLTAAVTETTTATDTQSATNSTTASVTESATATDTQGATKSSVESVTETATATDTQDATKVILLDVTETASATDTQSAAKLATVSVTETASATDTQGATKSSVESVAETAIATDTQSATRATSAAIVESASATDTQNASKLVTVSSVETATATDTQSATKSSVESVVESATATDTQGATRATSAAVVESTSASDTQDAIKVTLVSVTETATATDTQSATKSSVESVVESTTATDTQSATRATSAAVVEAASATHSQDAIKVTLVSVTETATATDTQSATRTAAAAVVESATATDTQSATLVRIASVVETAIATDTQSATKTTSASVTETASATDTTNATKVVLVSVSETANATDTQGATRATSASVVESANATSSQDADVGNNVSVNESANATDSQSATLIALAAVVEAATATDSQSATRATSASVVESASAVHSQDALRTLALSVSESAAATSAQSATNYTYALVQETASASDSQDAVVYSSIVVSAAVTGLLGVVSATSTYGAQSFVRKKSVIPFTLPVNSEIRVFDKEGLVTLTLKKISK